MRPFLIVVFLLTLSINSRLNADSLTVAADPWCPYNCNASDIEQGFMIEIATAIFKNTSLNIQYKNVNWARAKVDLNNGSIDAVVGMTKGKNLNQWIFPREELGIEQMCVYTLDENWKYTSPQDFYEIRLGIINSYGYGDDADNYLAKNEGSKNIVTISGSNALKRLTEMLQRNRIDAFIENRFVMDYFLKGSSSKLKMAGCISAPREVHIVFSLQNPQGKEYAEQLSKGIIQLRNNGKLTQILAKYGIEDWKPQ